MEALHLAADPAPVRRTRPDRLRAAALVAHRWVGLATAAFLLVAGLTGVMMAFYPQLDPVVNPHLYVVEAPADGRPMLDPLVLHERVVAQFPDDEVDWLILERTPGRSVNYWIDDQETFIDPYTAEVMGRRTFGHITEGRENLLTFLYRVHYTLGLGDVGTWLMGVVALLWTVDCFVGAYLTFPPRPVREGEGIGTWTRRWARHWGVKTGSLFAGVFTWHRASGLWVWGVLLVFAWSAVGLNLHDEVYAPAMDLVLPGGLDHDEEHLDVPLVDPALDLPAALDRGRALMAEEAARRGFVVIGEKWIGYEADHGTWAYTVESTLDIDERLADTTVEFGGDDGALVAFRAPTGLTTRGTVDSWLVALHFGAVRQGGLAYRAFVAGVGVLVTALSVTGVWIWLRKRR